MKNIISCAFALIIILMLSQIQMKAQSNVAEVAYNSALPALQSLTVETVQQDIFQKDRYNDGNSYSNDPIIGGNIGTADYKGIYVGWDTWTGKTLPDEVLKNPDVFGVLVKVFWKNVEPEPGVFDWKVLNNECNRAVLAGKKIAVSVIGGRHAPDWVYQTKGVRRLDFREAPGEGEDAKIESMSIPVPWDDAYLKLWQNLIKNFASDLKSDPEIWNAVVRVNVAGITLKTDEIRLPAQNKMKVGNKETTDAASIWQSVGYRPQLIIETWKKILKMYADNFDNKILSMAIIPLADFPTINHKGKTNGKRGWLTKDLVNYGVQTYKNRFAVQFDALTDVGGVTKIVTDAGKCGAIMGSQINHRKYADPDCLKTNTPCDNEAFKRVLDNGINNGFAWIEIFQNDVIAYPQAISYAKSKFK